MDITILGRLPDKDLSTLFPENVRSRPFSSFVPKDVHFLLTRQKNRLIFIRFLPNPKTSMRYGEIQRKKPGIKDRQKYG
jgi:hypothetical protein